MRAFRHHVDMTLQDQAAPGRVLRAMGRDDLEAIKRETEALGQVIQSLGASFYQQPGAAGPEQTPPNGGPGGSPDNGPEDVVDGEFKSA